MATVSDSRMAVGGPRLRRLVAVGAAVLAAGGMACEIDTFLPPPGVIAPAGVISGTVTYAGPPPCTEGGHVVGAALLSAYAEHQLPPPEGLGTSPAGLGVVTGDELFAGVHSQLVFLGDGERWCPAADAADVVVSAPFTVSPLAAGVYQIRGFYDRDGDAVRGRHETHRVQRGIAPVGLGSRCGPGQEQHGRQCGGDSFMARGHGRSPCSVVVRLFFVALPRKLPKKRLAGPLLNSLT